MFGSIVVGTDGSDTARVAVRKAVDLAVTHGATLDVVSAFEPPSSRRIRAEMREIPEDLQWMLNLREEVEATLRDAEETARSSGVEVETFSRDGDAADAILDLAEERGTDLIVVGNKGMTGAKRFLLGSIPNKISHHATCDVLIVRTT